MTPFEQFLCLFLILISGYISSSEIALFSLSRFQLRSIKEHLRPSVHQNIKRLLADPGGLLMTILVINEILNISLSTMITNAVAVSPHPDESSFFSFLPSWALHSLLGTLITAPLVLLACEITPKVIGARANQLVASLTADSLLLLYNFFKPIRILLGWLIFGRSRKRSRLTSEKITPSTKDEILKESDFLLMIEEGHRDGTIRENEVNLIKKVFELDHIRVSETLKPLSETVTISAQTTVKQALHFIRNQKYSRIPVISGTTPTKKVVGILYAKDLLLAKLDPELLELNITAIMRKPLFVSENIRLSSLFRRLKQERTHLAIIQKDHGIPLGIMTMSDVLEALFEDILEIDEKEDATNESRGSS